ncbi:MAG: hypothetical protein KUA35_09215 [Pseudodesulfovibrio sp.]|uniref:Uncharacterized protein n=1 Tax=Pseudodesulfovibrio aespoeensis (strain ATCC 700646 / DSM 10631 / Aspo-2) TaxID=643562 RepID=E6VX46_PSEA9|nr:MULTISPECIES: hypothetical protein [Pseudodesulfovibrio]MBU4379788.1 hypothetical protein [Pseudomonadota bacterium]ADU61452.1 hypothetical protein Daes_0428 [Pseudodesulfovibrio aespoeensis Aspo-2]MBU4475248.1 hypothetical protein [Pseudomonadota bacterium]MBU4516287.1 hypothetical protein [Pseudomonadota bacterium]MBU4522466.1 hypothetical protein [Pseudomonadota bacterium]
MKIATRLLSMAMLLCVLAWAPFYRLVMSIRDGISLTWMDWQEDLEVFRKLWREA